jgi:hypothetical protein
LKKASFRVSPADNRHKKSGITVRAAGTFASIHVDLPILRGELEKLTKEIADVVTGWGMSPESQIREYDDGGEAGVICFTYKTGTRELGKPVYHEKTRKLVGFLSKTKFTSIEDVPK